LVSETNSASLSSSQRWWVNSGAYLYTGNANGKTVSGALPASDSWFKEYAATNPEDTDGGAHPQNIFRLVQKGLWQNFSQEVYYTISAINQSASTNRNASNGLFLFNRYQNGDNLYYVGLRVDGNAVIKKKYNGTYYTMAFRLGPEPLWTPQDAQRWDCYGERFSTLEYQYLSGLDVLAMTGTRTVKGKYLFTAAPIGDGFSLYPEQAKEFTFVELENGRLTVQPTNYVIFREKSFTTNPDMQWPTGLKRQTDIWTCE
jgi:hypothetical protein